MPTWADLDLEFRTLDPALRQYRIDYQWGGGDVIELRGVHSPQLNRFEKLADIAGRKLSEVAHDELNPAVMARPVGPLRWYEALRWHSGVFEHGHVMVSEVGGVPQPDTYSGRVRNPADASATLALHFSALEPPPMLPPKRFHLLDTWRKRVVAAVVFLAALVGSVIGIWQGVRWIRNMPEADQSMVHAAPPPASPSAPVAGDPPSVESQNQSGGITAGTVNVFPSAPTPTRSPKPDVALRFESPTAPGVVIQNTSGVVAQNIKWWVLLFDIDRHDLADNPLPIAPIRAATFDFLRSHAASIPQRLSSEPGFFNVIRSGDRLYGSAIVDCPECRRSTTYFVYLKWGESGWYSVDKGAPSGQVQRPSSQSPQDTAAFVRLVESVPPSGRIPFAR
jgi:hypothetical protein